jgi:hypothetical protein
MDASQIARLLGRRGGQVRARRLSTPDKKRIASLGGVARAASLLRARRIVENLRYAAARMELDGKATAVTRLDRFEGRLPGIYSNKR